MLAGPALRKGTSPFPSSGLAAVTPCVLRLAYRCELTAQAAVQGVGLRKPTEVATDAFCPVTCSRESTPSLVAG